MFEKPTYQELEQRVRELEKAESEHKQTEEALLESEEKYHRLFDESIAAVYLLDEKKSFIDSNQAGLDLLGYSRDELLTMSISDVDANSTVVLPPQDQVLSGDRIINYEHKLKRKDGKVIAVLNNSGPVANNNGQVVGMQSTLIDITERKRTDEMLKQRTHDLGERVKELNCLYAISNLLEKPDISLEEIFQSVVDLIPTSLRYPQIACSRIILKDKEYKTENFKETNWKQSSEIFVNSKRMGVLEICYLEERPEIDEERFVKEERSLIKVIIERLGHIIERIQAENESKKSEEKFRSLVGNIPGVSYRCRCDEQWTMDFISDEVKNLTGYPASDFLQNAVRSWASIMHPEGKEASDERVMKKINRKEPYITEYRIIGADGDIRWCYEKGQGVFDEQGNLCFLDGVIVENTDRKQAEEALQESEEKYRTILESIEDGYYEIDLGGNFTFFNDSMCKISGYSRDELMGMNNRQYTDEVHAKEIYQTFKKVYTTGKPNKSFHWPVIRKNGTERTVATSVSLRRDTEGEPMGFRGIVRDISERKRFEAKLQQVTKMEGIATLAGGVAHEFNNTLMGIMGNIELLKINFSDDGGIDKQLESMEGAGHRMSRLTAQLLAYAEGGKYQPKDLKLDDFVIETLPILQHNLNPTVRVETVFPKDISYISADNAQMQMVLSAILTNSDEAIEDEGIIRITAENKDLDENFTKQHPGLKPGLYVSLTIEDDGKGMDEETKSGIFEPFFTTKFQGRGMGMAAVYGIIMNHDGGISVDSELGKGTAVQIYLPAIEIEVEKPKEAKADVSTGSGTILMIEDEDVVIEVTQAMLEMLGYRVMVAKTGKDAVHIAETFDGQIDLALLDIKLPDIDGGNLYPLIEKHESQIESESDCLQRLFN